MQKLILTFFIFCFLSCTSVPRTALQRQFPYGMVTDDYGILSKEDLQHYAADGYPHPLGGEVAHFGYWICAPVKQVTFRCRDFGKEITNEHNGEAEILIQTTSADYHFGGRHAFPIEGCHYKANLWKKMVAKQSHVCVSGEQAGAAEKINDKLTYGFIYDRIKTQKACDSWFDDGCKNEL